MAKRYALVSDEVDVSPHFKAVFRKKAALGSQIPEYLLPKELDHLESGDFISINPENQFIRVLYRSASNQNSITPKN